MKFAVIYARSVKNGNIYGKFTKMANIGKVYHPVLDERYEKTYNNLFLTCIYLFIPLFSKQIYIKTVENNITKYSGTPYYNAYTCSKFRDRVPCKAQGSKG